MVSQNHQMLAQAQHHYPSMPMSSVGAGTRGIPSQGSNRRGGIDNVMRTTVKSNNSGHSNNSWGVPNYNPPMLYNPQTVNGGQANSSFVSSGGGAGVGVGDPPNITNYTLIKEALAQHSRQKRKAMGAATVQSTSKKAAVSLGGNRRPNQKVVQLQHHQ